MPVALSISTAGGDEIVSALAELGRACDDVLSSQAAGPAVLRALHRQLDRHFGSEGATGRSGRWKALSPAYAAWKSRRYPGQPILQLTGRLKASLTGRGVDAIEIMSRRFLFVGSRVPYAGFHQEGTGRLPRRPPISPTDRDVAEWMVAIRNHFQRLEKRREFYVGAFQRSGFTKSMSGAV